jgi:hypothetical protein
MLHPVIEEGESLNDITVDNTYLITDASGVLDCPVISGQAVLDVLVFSDPDSLIQRITSCAKGEKPRVYIRQRSNWAWSAWYCLHNDRGNGNVLAEGVWFMSGNQTLNLVDAISNQPTGILLLFSAVDPDTGEEYDDEIQQFFVSKYAVNRYGGSTFNFPLISGDMEVVGGKLLSISDDQISGDSINTEYGITEDGRKYHNARWVLREVIGV